MSKKRNQSQHELLEPQTENQRIYFAAIEKSTVTICTGPPGTGKTFIACGIAAQKLLSNEITKIIIARPLVSCGLKKIGLLPGELKDKIGPWMRPLLDAFEDFIDPMRLNGFLSNDTIEMMPLEFMRGINIRNAFIICDEAQNAEYEQLHMLLTRFSYGTKVIITGDPSQSDLKSWDENALTKVARRLHGHNKISHVQLDRSDILRHGLIQWIDERLSGEERVREATVDCPACREPFTFPLKDHKNRETIQVECCHCRKILWVPEYDNGEKDFTEAEYRNRDCVKTYHVSGAH